MKRFATGLVVGKFSPLHLGHEHVINTALATCDHVVVLSYSRPEFTGCEPARRAAWLAARFPQTTRIVLDHATEPVPHNDEGDEPHRSFCAQIVDTRLDGRKIDAIFTSEDYGPGFAADLSLRQNHLVEHVAVDPARAGIPISGTALRSNIHGLRQFLSPEVYATFVRRVCILGGESTGKSVLAEALAKALNTQLVHEYGRELWIAQDGQLVFDDLLKIGREQVRREDAALLSPDTHRFLICDTSPLTTFFYSGEMFGRADPELEALAQRPYDFVVLCDDDIPFVQDGTRQTPEFRTRGQNWYRQQLAHTPHLLVSGSVTERINTVLQALGAQPSSTC